jgi:hypothetical protein
VLNLTLERIERQIRSLPVEHVYVLGPDNEILFHHTDDLPDQVRFPFPLLSRWEMSVVTHNHPGGKSFSPRDVRLACRANLAELRVVTRRRRYVVRPPLLGWAAVGLETLNHAIDREQLLLKDVLYDEIARQMLTTSLADEVAPHRLWQRLDALGLLRYHAEKW